MLNSLPRARRSILPTQLEMNTGNPETDIDGEIQMKKTLIILLTTLVVMAFTGTATADVTSLRGAHDLDANATEPDRTKQLIVKGGIDRSYKLQPPVIPHTIDKETINLKINTCMKCHSEKTYQEKKAPKAGDSHYVNRDGEVQKTVASRRYFCDQCHAPQVIAEPLVENLFEGAK